MKRRIALLVVVLLAAYSGYEWLRIRRTLAAADLAVIPVGYTSTYGAGDEPYTVVVLGDSTAHGIGTAAPEETFGALVARALAEERGGVRLVNLGVSGARAREVVDGQLPRVAALEPDLVLLSVGANDVTGWTDTDAYLDSVAELLDGQRATGARVAVLNVPAIVSAPLLPLPVRLLFDVRTHRYNAGLRELTRGREGVVLVPIYEQTREPFERDRTYFSADAYHPSPKGYALWAEVILRSLKWIDGPRASVCGSRARKYVLLWKAQISAFGSTVAEIYRMSRTCTDSWTVPHARSAVSAGRSSVSASARQARSARESPAGRVAVLSSAMRRA